MASHTFSCIDGHTCGNPVRLVSGGGPRLEGANMLEKRAHFLREFDWIRTGLMFEPRGHDMMSGSILYPPTRRLRRRRAVHRDLGLPADVRPRHHRHHHHGHRERADHPARAGQALIEAPAGKVDISYRQEGRFVEEVRLTNVPGFLMRRADGRGRGLGEIVVDVAYGGNFYAIVEPQKNFRDMADHTAGELVGWSPKLRAALNAKYEFVHPEHPRSGLSHIQWTGKATKPEAHARNAVFYGDKAIDRSPCGTGTSARMAQLAAKGKLAVGDEFVHESIIGSLFKGRVEAATTVADRPRSSPPSPAGPA
jgi:4-hydroxyproline epimerase